MNYLSEQLMDQVWRRVGSGTPQLVAAMQKRHRKAQPALVKFAWARLAGLDPDPAGVGLYVFHVLVEAFSGLTPRPREVRRPSLDYCWALPELRLGELAVVAEPYATQYLEEALSDADDVELSEAEWDWCARVGYAAILSLHGACGEAFSRRGSDR